MDTEGKIRKIVENVQNNDVQCKNNPNSCERALCECDAQFARDHVAKKDVFDPQYHLFWSTNDGGEMWDPKDNCARGFGIPYIPQDEISISKHFNNQDFFNHFLSIFVFVLIIMSDENMIYDLSKCCTVENGAAPSVLFNAAKQHCCPDGRIVLNPIYC